MASKFQHMGKTLVIGSLGQIGTELVGALREKKGVENVVGSDIRHPENPKGLFEIIDASSRESIESVVSKHDITEVYHLAAILSAKAEASPLASWNLNMDSLFHILEMAKEGSLKKIFWPSSIAVFGPSTPKENTPQFTITEPNTVYGISKLSGERWCEYYFQNYGVDVRSVRYPGLIGYKSLPGGGTTDYAVDIFHKAFKGENFVSFLGEDTNLPMMYMQDAIRATIGIMDVSSEKVKIRSSYNLAAFSFTPEQIWRALKGHFPNLEVSYEADFRQKIADSWPDSIDDSEAQKDWGWKANYTLESMVEEIVKNLPSVFPEYSLP